MSLGSTGWSGMLRGRGRAFVARRSAMGSFQSFGLYFLSFAASTVIILTAPSDVVHDYLFAYNASSVVFSFAFFWYYTHFCRVVWSRIILAAFVVATISLALVSDSQHAVLALYPGMLIFVDYLATQSATPKRIQLFRLFLILSVLPFLISPDAFQRNLLIRYVLLAVCALLFLLTAKGEARLSVSSPIRYLIGNYGFYNGVLITLAWVEPDPTKLRIWYISCQVGFILVLKLLDFSLRKSTHLDANVRRLVVVVGALSAVPAFIIYPDVLNLCLFLVGFSGLIYTGRFIGDRKNSQGSET